MREVPSRPGKADVDSILSDLGDLRLVVAGTDADLNAVVLRLLRTELLGEVPVGYVPLEEDSAVADLWGLPTDPGRALDLALAGEPDPVPLVRDDVGGVLVGRGVLGPVRGVGYADDTVVLRGQASRLEVRPDRELGLVVSVIHKRLFGNRVRETAGRAFQLGCLPLHVVSDGITHPRALNKWTWYRHTEDLRLVRGVH
ncbi:hypothetical protein F4559_006851 [Saccharothrix violaceirubra]|uniref:DAGKc domain-containing protein n=1 Tax=Saccharothrix violaceirubra TaxID=413306 RepID=A0A7W7TBD6_9PSEU|nr:hypothetical protein [Saccharothrix violaceirubra]